MTDTDKALDVDLLANEIRRVDGENSLGAGALAEALMPFIPKLSTQGWRTIDSAPKDGTGILVVWKNDWGVWRCVANWHADGWYIGDTGEQQDHVSDENTLLGWQPLPTPPEGDAT